MDTNVISGAVAALNKANSEVAQQKAVGIVMAISVLIKRSAELELKVMDMQGALAKLQAPEFSPASILGGILPEEANQNPNQKTIAAVLKTLTEGKQSGVKARAESLVAQIMEAQTGISAVEVEITKKREELAAVSPEVVEESVITSN